MKKFACVVLVAILVLCGFALAETVYVTISNGSGELVMAYAAVEVSDADGDGVLTIDDALFCAHDAAYEGGAAAGYVSAETEYGKSIYKLWGEENGGSYGYYLNDASAMSLLDAVADGDLVHAYAYQDLEGWSDTYCYFSAAEFDTSSTAMKQVLTALVYDADWNLVPTPVEGAIITINGADTDIITAADGSFEYNIFDSEPGEYVISARSETMTLVPPVWVVSVS
ncbi:MAG: hypothetical protein IJ466_10770 [Clostridia bacterium]|nr:hypothetical protein [Clostridia bacterium]